MLPAPKAAAGEGRRRRHTRQRNSVYWMFDGILRDFTGQAGFSFTFYITFTLSAVADAGSRCLRYVVAGAVQLLIDYTNDGSDLHLETDLRKCTLFAIIREY